METNKSYLKLSIDHPTIKNNPSKTITIAYSEKPELVAKHLENNFRYNQNSPEVANQYMPHLVNRSIENTTNEIDKSVTRIKYLSLHFYWLHY